MLEYGFACRYNRTLRKRGRKPVTRDGPRTETNNPSSTSPQGSAQDQEAASEPSEDDSITGSHDRSTTRQRDSRSTATSHADGHAADNDRAEHHACKYAAAASLPPGDSLNPDTRVDLGATTPGHHDSKLHCRYKVLQPALPLLQGIINTDTACDLLELYFAEPDTSLFRGPSPYVLTPVIRKKSLLHLTQPRETSPTLLVTILWVSAQTAVVPPLLRPGRRPIVCEGLRRLATRLISERVQDMDSDVSIQHDPADLLQRRQCAHMFSMRSASDAHPSSEPPLPCWKIDDILTLVLISIVISGGDTKAESLPWWSKALQLAERSGLNWTDGTGETGQSLCDRPGCSCRQMHATDTHSLVWVEAREERRRLFWVMFALDRHLALSFNRNIFIPDHGCQAFNPLPDDLWENLESVTLEQLSQREYGPPTLVTGVGFFQYFLPLMTILGDIVRTHHRRLHPRLGRLDNQDAVRLIEDLLLKCGQSIQNLSSLNTCPECSTGTPHACENTRYARRLRLVTLYAQFILHVLHVLLHGRWDPVCMLSPDQPSSPVTISDHMDIRNWIASISFLKCASNSIAASEVVSEMLAADPELSFSPYLFGIYLLHGSFILLLFAHRMPDVGGGPNESVERACETIIRAHEVCVVTLSTEFQRNFRRVLRATLHSVRHQNGQARTYGVTSHRGLAEDQDALARRTDVDDGVASRSRSSAALLDDMDMIQKVLSLYRWAGGGKGLGV